MLQRIAHRNKQIHFSVARFRRSLLKILAVADRTRRFSPHAHEARAPLSPIDSPTDSGQCFKDNPGRAWPCLRRLLTSKPHAHPA